MRTFRVTCRVCFERFDATGPRVNLCPAHRPPTKRARLRVVREAPTWRTLPANAFRDADRQDLATVRTRA